MANCRNWNMLWLHMLCDPPYAVVARRTETLLGPALASKDEPFGRSQARHAFLHTASAHCQARLHKRSRVHPACPALRAGQLLFYGLCRPGLRLRQVVRQPSGHGGSSKQRSSQRQPPGRKQQQRRRQRKQQHGCRGCVPGSRPGCSVPAAGAAARGGGPAGRPGRGGAAPAGQQVLHLALDPPRPRPPGKGLRRAGARLAAGAPDARRPQQLLRAAHPGAPPQLRVAPRRPRG